MLFLFSKEEPGDPSAHRISLYKAHNKAQLSSFTLTAPSMALSFSNAPSLLCFFLLISCATACDRCVHQSKAASFSSSSSSPLSAGACGYGSLAPTFNKGFIASASSSLYRDGIGCGACYQVRCKHARLCSTKGVTVIITDRNDANGTDFVLNAPAFVAMARAGSAQQLKEAGAVDVEYKRVPCVYNKKKNLSVRVEEGSKKPSNLTIMFLYQGGQTDIMGVDVARFGSSNWQFMTRVHGPVWATDRAPAGPLQLRMVVTGGYDGKWVWAQKEVLPSDWMIGGIYDTGVQITDIAQEGCSHCDDDEWK